VGRRKIPRHGDETPLELDEPAMRKLVELATDRIVKHIASLPTQPVHATRGGKKLAHALREPLPERGAPIERLLRLLFGRIIPTSLNTASPGYLAYVPGGGVFAAAVADLVALATNRYASVWLAAPGLAQIEQNVISWIAGIVGMPPDASGGLLLSGGSMANLVALVTARRDRLPPDFSRGVLYTSDQAHHSVLKAAVFAGIAEERVRMIPSDDRFRVRADRLAEAMKSDAASGLVPFCVVGHGGTTNTGAVDDLAALADLAQRHRAWFHVDAAYGGFFAMTDRGRSALRGIERADSVTLDPHKSLFLPYGTGALVVRDRAALRRAHAMHATYMPPMQDDAELVDFCDLGPELSREARGLRVWLPLKLHGAAVFRAALDEKIDLARQAAEGLRAIPDLTIVADPELSLLAFRLAPAGAEPGPDLDELNRRFLAAINQRNRVLLTGATVAPGFVLRVCVLSFRTHADRIEMLIEDARAARDEVLRVASGTR
jgi:aromatic-L-amino-acid decarboxylase